MLPPRKAHVGFDYRKDSSSPRYKLIPLFNLQNFPWSVSSASGKAGNGIAGREQADRAIIDWIPVNIPACAVYLDCCMRANASRLPHLYLSLVTVYATTYGNFPQANDEFKRLLSLLPPVCVFGDLTTKNGHSTETRWHVSGRFYGSNYWTTGESSQLGFFWPQVVS